MKPHFKIIAALMVIVAIGACEKEIIEPVESPGQYNKFNSMIKFYDSEIVLKWNEALALAIDNQIPTPVEARTYAMVSLAMHDALNNIVAKYESYALDNTFVNSKVNLKNIPKKHVFQMADAAVSQAAYDALVTLFPAAKDNADNLLALCLAEIEDSDFKDSGITIGKEAAAAVLVKRQNDPPLLFSSYSMGTEPGVHQANYLPFLVANPPVWPANAVYAANLGSYVPFGIESADQFRSVPPYAVNSSEYTTDYNEVKRLGCNVCPDRTDEQSEIGAFWRANTPGLMNNIARTLAIQEKLNGWETARLIALTQMAQIDAHIASFETKFYYNFWLPVTAIRAGDTDGNDNTQGDANWTAAVTPPPTPDYTSTQATSGGAGAAIFRLFFGTDKKSFTITSPNSLPGVERSFDSFSQASTENANSRIYLGSHFRISVIEGEKQGNKIGNFVFRNNLRELKFSL